MKNFNVEKAPYLKGKILLAYLYKHLKSNPYSRKLNNSSGGNHSHSLFWRTKKPLFVFKKVWTEGLNPGAIANFEISVGESIHLPLNIEGTSFVPSELTEWKLRYSGVKVHSLRLCSTGSEVKEAYSMHDESFKYKADPTQILRPTTFSMKPSVCAEGIHFFLNLKDAWEY